MNFIFNLLFILFLIHPSFTAWNFGFDVPNPEHVEDAEVLKHLNTELMEMRKELTASFVADHSRRKREVATYEYRVKLTDLKEIYGTNITSKFQVDQISRRAAIFLDEIYIFEQYGIHQIQFTHVLDKNLVRGWTLLEDSRVLASMEKKGVMFILVSSPEEDFTFLFTYSPESQSGLVLRQRIRTYGIVTDAQFFIYLDELYLIVTHDNQVNSITMCPIFKWMGTYFDEIHTVHTRGASAVDVFVIAGYQYIAIAQAVDGSGNSEIGTQLLRIDRQEEIEKVQLLYSNAPTSLHFSQFLHEYILIIAQERENALVYFFGGYDFIFLQHLPILVGSDITVVSVLGPDGETYILGSNGAAIYTFSRAESSSPLTSLIFSPYPNATYEAPNGFTITGMTVKLPKDEKQLELTVAIELASATNHMLELYAIKFEQRPKALNVEKPPEDNLSKCMLSLEKTLLDGQPLVDRLEKSSSVILRKSSNMNYPGELVTSDTVTIDGEGSNINDVKIVPKVEPKDASHMSPSQIMDAIANAKDDFNHNIEYKLKTKLLRNETRTISGSLTFPNGVNVDNMKANRIELNNFNGIPWQRILRGTLKVSSEKPQVVTGNWELNVIEAQSANMVALNNVGIQDILLTEMPNNTVQYIRGPVEFMGPVNFAGNITVPYLGYINEIQMKDIVINKPGSSSVITGKKSADVVHGGPGLVVELLNRVRVDQWYEAVLKTKGPPQRAGVFIFNNEVECENVTTIALNGRNWNTFVDSVLINGKDQTLQGTPELERLVARHLRATYINGLRLSDLMTSNGTQAVRIPIQLEELLVHGNITTDYVNGLRIPEDVVIKNEAADVYGPVTFQNLTTNYLNRQNQSDDAAVSDIERVLNAKKTVIYKSDQPIYLDAVEAADSTITTVNEVPISDFDSRYWTKTGPNDVLAALDLSKITIYADTFTTENINGAPVGDFIQTVGNQTIRSHLKFRSLVTLNGELKAPATVTLNGFDFSAYAQNFVRRNDSGRVFGAKTFTKPLNATKGVWLKYLNGYTVPDDFVFLHGRSYNLSDLSFKDLEAAGVEVEGPVSVGSRVNGFDLKSLVENTARLDEPLSINSDVTFTKDLHVEDFNVGGRLNGLPITQVLSHLILLDNGGHPQYLYVNLDVEGNVTFNDDATVGFINGVDPRAYFASLVNRKNDEIINGTKIFHGPVVISENLECSTVNNISLQALKNDGISKSRPQEVTGSMAFDRIEAKNVQMRSICGIPLSDFVRIDDKKPQTVESKVVFTSMKTLVEGDVHLDGLLNGEDIYEVVQGLTSIKGKREFNMISCAGDLSWNSANEDLKSFSYLFANAVKNTGNRRPVKGNVKFAVGLKADNITSARWINGVDLSKLEQDGVFLDRPINFTGKNRIREVFVEGSDPRIRSLSTPMVNGVNLKELNSSIVRGNDTKPVSGIKTFNGPMNVKNLHIKDINGCQAEDIVQVDDNRTIESLLIDHVEDIGDLEFQTLRGLNWTEFLEKRVTKSTPQNIQGDWTFEDEVYTNDMLSPSINDLDLSTAVKTNASEPQEIYGAKTVKSIHILGDFKAGSVNNLDIQDLHTNMIYKDRATHFNQTVYLEGPVTFNKDIHIEKGLNERNLDHIENHFAEQLHAATEEIAAARVLRFQAHDMLRTLYTQLEETALWLDYLKLDVEFKKFGSRRVEAAVLDQVAHIVFSKIVRPKNGACSLPEGCLANLYSTVQYGSNGVTKSAPTMCETSYYLSSEIYPVGFQVQSNGVSYNMTCQSSAPEETRIYAHLHNLSGKTTEVLIGTISTGYVTDTKTFHWRGHDYIVISQLFNKEKSSSVVQVYAVINDESVQLIQEIETSGTVKLAVSFNDQQVYLGVANTMTHIPVTNSDTLREDLDHCETFSSIFIWSPRYSAGDHGEFVILRDVATRNIIGMEFIVVYPFQFEINLDPTETFAVFIHSVSLVEIFKWSDESKNFLLFQTIALDDEYQVTGVSTVNLRDSTYLVLSSVPQGLLIYEYRCIEGFQLYLQVPIENAFDVTTFEVNGHIYLPVASPKSLITIAHIQGPQLD